MKVKRIAGSSAGSICAGLLSVGCTPQEIADVFKCDIKWLFHGNLSNTCSVHCMSGNLPLCCLAIKHVTVTSFSYSLVIC